MVKKKKICVRLPNWLGDLVMSTGFLNALAMAEPDADIDIIVKESLREMVPLLGNIHQTILFSKKTHSGITGAIRCGKECAAISGGYDSFYSLPDSFSSGLTAFFSKSCKRIGYAKELRSPLLTHAYNKKAALHRAEEYVTLLKYQYPMLDIPIRISLKKPLLNIDSILNSTGLEFRKKIVFNINSAAESRRIPPMKAVSIARKLLDGSDCILIFTGSKEDKALTELVIKNIDNPKRCINVAGKTTLESLATICAGSDCVLSTDSGIAHVANALDTPVVVLFGAGNEENTAPYNKSLLTIIRAPDIPCAPCVKNDCRFKHVNCMNNLDEQQIVYAVRKYLERS